MENTIKQQLLELADEKYKAFTSALIPNINNIMGVRLPELRKIAKQLAKGDWRTYLAHAEADWFEEVMLQGMVIGSVKAEIDEVLRYVAEFVPKIDNWSVCDSFCASLKITAAHKQAVWQFLQPYLRSSEPYEIRFAVVMLLNYYVDDEYIGEALRLLDSIRHEDYYVKMAVAWAVSIYFVKLPAPTLAYLKQCTLDNETYNKALQKIIESTRTSKETKDLMRSMKRK